MEAWSTSAGPWCLRGGNHQQVSCKTPASGCFIGANLLQNKIRTCPPAQAHKTSVHDIEHALLLIACHHPESSATIRSFASYNLYSFDTTLEAGKHFRFDAASTLCILYRQLNGTQAKWLTRILLKNFGARKLFPDGLDLKATFRLPKCIEQFALPDRVRPGLLSFKSILKGVDTPPPTPPIMTSNISTMPTPISQLQKKLAPPQVSTLLPTPPTTIKKSVNSLVSLLKKRKLALSYPNINKRSVRLPVSPPPLRRSQPPVPPPILPKEDKTVSHEPSTLTKTLTKTIPMPAASVNGLTSSQAADIRHSNSITINLQTNHLTCSEPKTPSLPISTQEPVLKRTQIVSKPSTNPKKYTKRMPLSSIEDNSQSQNTHVSVSSSSGAKDSVRGRPPSKSKGSGSRIRISGTGVCRLTHTKCQLANCIFLLSSCISDDPWVSDSLLAWHGSRFTKSMRAFVNLQFSAQNSQTEKNTRKIILVDTKRTLQTVDFLKRVQMQSSLSDGPKQWIEVYDWRLLEYMAKVDRGKEYTYDPWDRCKMCTI